MVMVSGILVCALSLAMLNSFPSDLECMYTPSVEFPKACFRRRENKIAMFVLTFDVKWFGHATLMLYGCCCRRERN